MSRVEVGDHTARNAKNPHDCKTWLQDREQTCEGRWHVDMRVWYCVVEKMMRRHQSWGRVSKVSHGWRRPEQSQEKGESVELSGWAYLCTWLLQTPSTARIWLGYNRRGPTVLRCPHSRSKRRDSPLVWNPQTSSPSAHPGHPHCWSNPERQMSVPTDNDGGLGTYKPAGRLTVTA